MTMTEALYEIAPNTTKMFASWLMEGYGLSLKEFEKATPKRKFYEVSRYFGYPLDEDTKLPVSEIIKFIKEKFADYENLMQRYPDGIPDPMKAIKGMSYEEREIWLKKHFVSMIRISLQHAIIDGNGMIRVSLKNSLIERKLTALELESRSLAEIKAVADKFWEETIKNFDPQTIAPF